MAEEIYCKILRTTMSDIICAEHRDSALCGTCPWEHRISEKEDQDMNPKICKKCGEPKDPALFYDKDTTCKKCRAGAEKARRRADATRADARRSGIIIPGPVPTQEVPIIDPAACDPAQAGTQTGVSFAIEIGGTRIRVCKSCLKEFLGI